MAAAPKNGPKKRVDSISLEQHFALLVAEQTAVQNFTARPGLNTLNTLSNTPMSNVSQPRFKVGDIVTWGSCTEDFLITRVYPDSYALQSTRDGHKSRYGHHELDFKLAEVKLPKPVEPPKPKVDFDTVVMPDEKRQQILEALEQIHQHDLIFKTWGFGSTMEKGKGVSMLFYGEPGTGKTLACQGIADKLGYTLKVIGTADVESSAPGEAERNIRKHFKEASDGKTLLLFDECDSLIYTRSQVGPIMAAQINELLSQLERFNGVTVFTTNRLGTLDEAVNRRLALKLEFAMPTPSERAEIWQRMFPIEAPLSDDVDWLKLASIEVSGGYIKNAVLRAARMAAIEKLPNKKKMIRMNHLVRALRLETVSMLEFEAARTKYLKGGAHVSPEGLDMDGEKVVHKVSGGTSHG